MTQNEKEYQALFNNAYKLFKEDRHEEAIALWEKSYAEFPEKDFDMKSSNLWSYMALNNYGKCLEILNEQLSKGQFYLFSSKAWEPLSALPQWKNILEKNEENRALIGSAQMKYMVFTSEEFDKSEKYPCFFILHGDGENIEEFKNKWEPDFLLQNKFIVVYIQSSSPSSATTYGWTRDYGIAGKDIYDCYNCVCNEFSVDRAQIYIGGFSGGAMASLYAVMNNIIPVRGVLALCALGSEDCTIENIQKAASRGIRMVLAEGEYSGEIPFQSDLIKSAKRFGLPVMSLINENEGHSIPEYWDRVVKKALEFLNQI